MKIELLILLVIVAAIILATLIPKLCQKKTIKIGHMKLQDNQSWKLDLENVDTRNAVLNRVRPYQPCTSEVIKIQSSGRTHVANYTKYRYNGSSNRDVEVWHSPTNIWVPYYLMFSTPFEDSCIRYNGEDVTSSGNYTVIAQQEAPESTLSSSQYDGSKDDTSCDTARSRSYYDDSYSSSSSSDSYSDSGSSSSSNSSDY